MRKVILCAPSRIYEDHPKGRFSHTAMVDYFHGSGIGGIDMSFENLSRLGEGWQSILYAAAKRAERKGIRLPVCHLSFYMPDPNDKSAMVEFTAELERGIDAARIMGIDLAVTHPIVRRTGLCDFETWKRENVVFLSPIVQYAGERGVKICVENMADRHRDGQGAAFGRRASDIVCLADALGCGVCWDVGHAHISGLCNSVEMSALKGRILVLHVHDNNGYEDQHLLPFEASVDFDDVARGIEQSGFCGILDVEVSAWALPADCEERRALGGRIVMRGNRLMNMSGLI